MATANSKLKIDFGYDSYGTSNVHGDMDITGSLSVGGNLAFSGTTIGNFIPDQDQRSLGNTINRWNLIGYSANLASTLTVTGSASLQDTLTVTSTISGGNTTIAGFANVSTSVNSALLTVGTSFVANTTGAYHTGTINATSFTSSNSTVTGIVVANNSGVYPSSNSAGSELGTSSRRWIVNGNTGNFSGSMTVSGESTLTGNATLSGSLQTISGNVSIDSGTLFVDSNNNRVGINNTAPTVAFYVVGAANVTTSVNSAILSVGTSFIANTTGAYHTGSVNADSHTVGSNFVANSTAVTLDGVANLTSATSTIRVGNSSVNTFVNSSVVLTGVGNFSVGANVGANVSLSNTSLSIGNSTSNSTVTNSLLSVSNSTSTANVSPLNLVIGASVVNSTGVFVGVGNFTSIANVGSNVSINTSAIFVGNSTSNFSACNFSIRLNDPTSTANLTANSLHIGSTLVNSSVITIATGNFSTGANVGSNVNLTTSSLQIGNSTVNTQVNSSVFSTGTGNFSVAANVGSNVKLTTVLLSIGNSTVNSLINSTSINIGSSTFVANASSVVISNPLTANGGTGTSGQILASNGSSGSPYWITGVNVNIADDTTTNGSRYLLFANQTSNVLSAAYVSSTKLSFNPSTGTLSSTVMTGSSDERLKTNIETIQDPTSTISQLRGVSFNRIDNGLKDYGVIAQEIEKVLPDVVHTDADGYRTVSYSSIIGFLIEAVKKQQEQIDVLMQDKYKKQ
jgi:hypothetical protein